MTLRILAGHVLDRLRELLDESVHMCVTSPPYWGLRDYGTSPQMWGDWRGSLGLEPTYQLYVEHVVQIMREVRRVLRKDGTLWLNMGDCYATGAGKAESAGGGPQGEAWEDKGPSGYRGAHGPEPKRPTAEYAGFQPNRMPQFGLKPKDLVGVPWRVAFALQDNGWWLRRDIIWSKPNSMPESVEDRPTTAHEYMFLLTKSARYFYDAEAIKEESVDPIGISRGGSLSRFGRSERLIAANAHRGDEEFLSSGSRNKRSVWTIATTPFPEAHFATFPPALVEPCIKAGTSERGVCPKCGAPWTRVIKSSFVGNWNKGRRDYLTVGNFGGPKNHSGPGSHMSGYTPAETIGWRATCSCVWNAPGAETPSPVPATVLDPFLGAGTTALVADRLQRNCIGIELSEKYAEMARRRISDDAGLFLQMAAE